MNSTRKHKKLLKYQQRRSVDSLGETILQVISQYWMSLATLVLIVFGVYVNSLTGGFVSDDIPIIAESKTIGTWGGVFARVYVPWRNFLYFIIYNLFGANPAPFHLLNITLHSANVLLVYLIIHYLYNRRVALFASVIFAVHPVMSEAVSWISGGSYLDYSFFLLLSFLFFIRYIKAGMYYKVSVVTFLLGLLSGDRIIVYPVILLLYFVAISEFKKRWKSLIPFFVLSLIWGLLFLSDGIQRIQGHTFSFGKTDYIDNPFLFVATVITSYLKLLFWPNKLTFFHSEFILNTRFYLSMIFPFIIFLILIGVAWLKNKQIFFWLAFFVISLGVTLLPLKISWIIAERYVYLGSVGIFTAVALVVDRLFMEKEKNRYFFAILIFIAIILGIRTVVRNSDWQSEQALWTATVKSTPSNPVAHSSLGNVYLRNGNLEKAAAEFYIAIKLNPYYAEGYYNLGDVYRQANDLDQAEIHFKKSVELHPYLWQGYQALGAVYYLKKNHQQAIVNTEKALKIHENNAELHMNLGVMYYETGNRAKARQSFEKALAIDPNNSRALFGLEKVIKGL